MSSWSFESPQSFLLFILIPFGIYARHVWKGRGSVLKLSFTIYKAEKFKKKIGFSSFLFLVSSILFWLGTIALIMALAGPVKLSKDRVFLNRGVDVMFVLDLSPSMGAEDFEGNRFISAKKVIRNFISLRENDALGIVTFATEAALRVPPTLDYDLFLKRMDSFRLTIDHGRATAIGMGLSVASLHLKESTAKDKIIILLTDGDNNAGDIMPESAADTAAKLGIKIYVVGIGSDDEVPVEYINLETNSKSPAKITGSYNEELLMSVADISGGTFYSATSVNSLESIFNKIDSNESYEKRIKVNTYKDPFYKTFILLFFCFILADFFIRKVLLQEIMP